MEIAPPNTREFKVRAFLSKPPAKASDVLLTAASDGGERTTRLGSWTREEAVPALAQEVLRAVDDHVDAVGGLVVAQLAYVDDAGAVCRAMSIKRQASHVEAEASVAGLAADQTGVLTQMMRHTEACIQLMVRSQAALVQQAVEMNRALGDVNAQLASKLVEAESREHRERALRQQLEEALAELPTQTSPAPDVLEKLTPLLQAIAARALSAPAASGGAS